VPFVLQPWHLLRVIRASWINRQQQQVIDYLRTENQVLREQLTYGRRQAAVAAAPLAEFEAQVERFHGTSKQECLSRVIFSGRGPCAALFLTSTLALHAILVSFFGPHGLYNPLPAKGT
jgi:hypothetical protein